VVWGGGQAGGVVDDVKGGSHGAFVHSGRGISIYWERSFGVEPQGQGGKATRLDASNPDPAESRRGGCAATMKESRTTNFATNSSIDHE
jgi:hypothetical protein